MVSCFNRWYLKVFICVFSVFLFVFVKEMPIIKMLEVN